MSYVHYGSYGKAQAGNKNRTEGGLPMCCNCTVNLVHVTRSGAVLYSCKDCIDKRRRELAELKKTSSK